MIMALILSWLPVTNDCFGRQLLFPGQVTYAVPYLVREMAVSDLCPLDEAGRPQACAIYTGMGEWVTADAFLDVGATATPPVGVVFDVQEPVAVTPMHRSDEPCTP